MLLSETKHIRSEHVWVVGALILFAFFIYPSWSYFEQVYFKNPMESQSLWVLILVGFILYRESQYVTLDKPEGRATGLFVVLFFLALYIASVIADINLIAALFSIGLLGGIIHTLFGWNNFQKLIFPLFLLTLSLPITTILDLSLGYEVRLLSAKLSFDMLHFMGLAQELIGTKIIMAEKVLTVDSSCSGLKSLSILLIMNLFLGYLLFKENIWKRLNLVLVTFAIAGFANCIRITVIGVIADQYGLNYAMGVMHDFSGLIVFALSLFLLWPVYAYLEKK